MEKDRIILAQRFLHWFGILIIAYAVFLGICWLAEAPVPKSDGGGMGNFYPTDHEYSTYPIYLAVLALTGYLFIRFSRAISADEGKKKPHSNPPDIE